MNDEDFIKDGNVSFKGVYKDFGGVPVLRGIDLKVASGEIDILVNNSGVSKTQKILDVQPEDFDYTFGANTKGAFFVAQAIGRRMLLRAKVAQDSNQVLPQQRIIQVASITGLKAIAQISVYCMSKAAVVQMTKAMALEWGRYGINVNAIGPGWVKTELTGALQQNKERYRNITARIPLGRWAEPEDLAGTAVFFEAFATSFYQFYSPLYATYEPICFVIAS